MSKMCIEYKIVFSMIEYCGIFEFYDLFVELFGYFKDLFYVGELLFLEFVIMFE